MDVVGLGSNPSFCGMGNGGNRGMLETKGEHGQGQGFQRSIAMAQDLQAALLRLGTCGT